MYSALAFIVSSHMPEATVAMETGYIGPEGPSEVQPVERHTYKQSIKGQVKPSRCGMKAKGRDNLAPAHS
jgi:hypothetical protein